MPRGDPQGVWEVQWITLLAIVVLVAVGIRRLSVQALLGLSLLIGLVDAKWLNPTRKDYIAHLLKTRSVLVILLAVLLLLAGVIWPYRF